MSQQEHRRRLWYLVNIADDKHVSFVSLLLASFEMWERFVKQCIANEVFVVPSPTTLDCVFDLVVQHLRMEGREVVPMLL